MSQVTQILDQIQQGNRAAASELLPLVYEELRRLALHRMRNEKPGHTLQPTALVHEAYIRLVGDVPIKWDGRAHFFAAAAEAMRRILIENARRHNALKRGGNISQKELAHADGAVSPDNIDELLDLDAALTKLALAEPELAALVELRFFAGLTVERRRRPWAFQLAP
jgi:RNA polymerase sigma factor (TIGR02999 family)